MGGILTNPLLTRACATLEINTSFDLDSDSLMGTFNVLAADCNYERDMSTTRTSLKAHRTISLAEAIGMPCEKRKR